MTMKRRAFIATLLTGIVAGAKALPLIKAPTGAIFIPHPKQVEFFIDNEKYVFYGGSAGGGKSDYFLYLMKQANIWIFNPKQCAMITNIGDENEVRYIEKINCISK